MIETKEDREKRVRRTGRRGGKRRLLRRVALIILIPLLVLLIWQYDYQGISIGEGAGMVLAGVLIIVYFAAGIRRKPVRGWAKIEQERREAQRIRRKGHR